MRLSDLGYRIHTESDTHVTYRLTFNDGAEYKQLYFTTDHGGRWTCEATWHWFVLRDNTIWEEQRDPKHRSYRWSARFGHWETWPAVIERELAHAIAEHLDTLAGGSR